MARLIYSAITSLDGYVADRDGKFDWAEPDEEMHTFVTRAIGRHLPGDSGPRRPAAVHPRLRRDLAGGR
jgi:hypothetical protein